MSEDYTDEHAEPLDPPKDEAMEPSVEVLDLPLAPDRAGGKDLLKVLGIVWFAEIILGIVVVAFSSRSEGAVGASGLQFEPWAVVCTASISAVITIWACWRFACKRYGLPLAEGLYLKPVSRRITNTSAIAGVVCAIVGGLIAARYSTGKSLIADLFMQPSSETPGAYELFYPMVGLALFAAVVEEIYYRGFLYSIFQRLLGTGWAMGIIIAWFGLLHAPQLAQDLVGLPLIVLMGALFTGLRYKYDSIWPSIACHLAYNGSIMAVSIISVEMHNAGV